MNVSIWRRIVQVLGLILPNSYFQVFIKDGSLYQGNLKGVVLPILNCYSTPSAYASCPMGSMQHFFVIQAFPAYVLGILGVVGITIGRLTCGWICPFGFIQDLLHKIPTPKIKLHKFFSYIKYAVLVFMVFLLPVLFEETFFCKFCPAGGLTGGIPQVLMNPPLREILGWLYIQKMIVTGLIVVFSILISRFFCRTFCPLGALLGLFNSSSIFHLQLNKIKCVNCKKCSKVCPVGIDPLVNTNSPECIRCLECVNVCKFDALKFKQGVKGKVLKQEVQI